MTNEENKTIEQSKPSREVAVVKHSNTLAEIPLKGFTAYETDLFWGLCFFCQGNDDRKVTISFSAVRELLGKKRRGDMALLKELDATSDKFSKLSISENTPTSFNRVVPFIGFKGDTTTKTFTVSVNPDFVDALNSLDGSQGREYTISDVKAIVAMKSTFSKKALPMLFMFRNTNYWYVTIEKLREFLSVPEGYKQSDVKTRVIEVIEKEFRESGIFEYIEIEEQKESSRGKAGRRRVSAYTFHFKFKEAPEIKALSAPEQETIMCKMCGKPLYRRRKKDGTYFFGHKDGHKESAKCRFTMSEVSVIEGGFSIVEEEPKKEDDAVGISRGDLENYYRHIREQAQRKATERREDVKNNDADLWKRLLDREEKMAKCVEFMTALQLSDETRAEKEKAREELRKSTEKLEEALAKRGYEKDYFSPQYKCKICGDTGLRDDGTNCSCKKKRAEDALKWMKRDEKV